MPASRMAVCPGALQSVADVQYLLLEQSKSGDKVLATNIDLATCSLSRLAPAPKAMMIGHARESKIENSENTNLEYRPSILCTI